MQKSEKSNENKVENQELSWNPTTQALASEIIQGREEVSKAKNFAIGCMAAVIVAVSLGMALINYSNDRDWRELFSSYDFVSQDGEGINSINTGEQGDLLNGAESQDGQGQE